LIPIYNFIVEPHDCSLRVYVIFVRIEGEKLVKFLELCNKKTTQEQDEIFLVEICDIPMPLVLFFWR